MSVITNKQLGLLHHTLGVTPGRRESYRNHFVAGPGHHDQANLEALEVAGLMERATTPKFLDQGDVVFRVTDAGRAYALEHLPPSPKYSRYEQYRRSECCESFAEWLGIELPRLERGDYWYKTKGLVRYRSSRATGEWAATAKAAKAGYKAVMQANRAAQKGCAA